MIRLVLFLCCCLFVSAARVYSNRIYFSSRAFHANEGRMMKPSFFVFVLQSDLNFPFGAGRILYLTLFAVWFCDADHYNMLLDENSKSMIFSSINCTDHVVEPCWYPLYATNCAYCNIWKKVWVSSSLLLMNSDGVILMNLWATIVYHIFKTLWKKNVKVFLRKICYYVI